MAELVAGAFLSSSLQVACERLASRELLDFFHGRKLEDGSLTKLRVVLLSVNQVIEDAEETQYQNHNVKQWLDELRDEVFKAEDLIDEIATEALRQKLDVESQTVTGKRPLFSWEHCLKASRYFVKERTKDRTLF